MKAPSLRRCLAATAVLAPAFVAAVAPSRADVALACTPPPGGLPVTTIADHVEAADITIEGTVSTLTADVSGLQTVMISVTRYVTGSGPALVTAGRFGPASLCLSEVATGQHSLFFIEEADDGTLTAFYLTQFDATAPADSASLAEAIAAAGHDPVPPDPSTRAIAAALSADSSGAAISPASASPAGGQSSQPLLAFAGASALAAVAVIAARARK